MESKCGQASHSKPSFRKNGVRQVCLTVAVVSLMACSATETKAERSVVESETVAQFKRPWAMTFLPDGRLLVTERAGALKLFDPKSRKSQSIEGVPVISDGGQGGFGDIILHPDYATNQRVYMSYVEADSDGNRGSVVAYATLDLSNANQPTLTNPTIIWRQAPKVSGGAHFGLRLVFGPDKMLFVTSGERRKFEVAQDMTGNLGKVLRLQEDGTPAPGNPFADQGGIAAQAWTIGNRNPLGIAFSPTGGLWAHEMGPAGGDELNELVAGNNYGYPFVSDGDHYSGRDIPDHSTDDRYAKPAISWNPVISPAGLIFYTGEMFPQWQGNALIGGLSARGLVRIAFEGNQAREVERIPMGSRVREVEQGPDGAVWILTDGSTGQLRRLTPN